MLWLSIAIISYAFFGFAALADRYLLAGPLPHPRAYAFYAGMSGMFAVVFVPFGLRAYEAAGFVIPQLFTFHVPPLPILGLSFAAAAVGVIALYLLYRAIFYGHISTTVPMIGALSPLVTIAISYAVVGEYINATATFWAALTLLIIGTVLLAFHSHPGKFVFSIRDLRNAAYVSVFSGAAFVLTKLVFNEEGFFNGFIWIAWGGSVVALLFLLIPGTRLVVFEKNPISNPRVWFPFLVGKGAGTAGSLMQNISIFLATSFSQLAIINALSGLQYFFILIFVAVFAIHNPHLLKEEASIASLSLRLAGAIIISIGLVFLFV
jgi:drug/metabolite transporter (DMT)-like permease